MEITHLNMNPPPLSSTSVKRTVLITGGSQGIGFAVAQKCLAEGCRVILVARNLRILEEASQRLQADGASGADIEIVEGDMLDCEGIPALVAKLPWVQEGLWGLVPNAALEILKTVKDFEYVEILDTLKINVISPILLIKACYPLLKKVQGNIVYVGSIADSKNDARYSVYGGSKAFMKSFVGHAGQEMGFDGLRINLVSPGGTDTELMRRLLADGTIPEEPFRAFVKSVPMEQRLGRPDEVADAVWFALSGPRYFHGEDIRIYGGHK